MDNDFMKALFSQMNEDVKQMIILEAARRCDRLVGTQKARRETYEMVKDDPEALEGYKAMCAKYDLNQMIVQNLGNIKAMLESFDPNDFSTVKADDNLQLYKNITNVMAIATISLVNSADEFNKEMGDKNETGDGDASG